MKTQDIAQRWLDFFAAKGHTVVPSASLISADPSILFNIAGMVPFVPYLSGREKAPYDRATSVQKCIRTADIDEVGKTVRHGTFFQMCGNFSFGDYFKEGAITFAWELLTSSIADGGYGLDPSRLWATVYVDGTEKDEEARAIWRDKIGIPEERIQGTGKADNFWSTGQPGPGGPCSEIYYDLGAKYGQEGGPIVDETRYIEIWNLVFMQYQLSAVRSKTDFDIAGDLPNRNIDTGLGLERLAMILQGVENLYETDQVRPVLDAAAELAGKDYTSTVDPADPHHADDVRLRVVADHIRSALMLIADGVAPSNEGRGYVLRRLIRRAVRAMRLMGVEKPCLPALLPVSREAMKGFYPAVEEDFERISRIAYAEEKSFLRTIASGTARLDEAVTESKAKNQPLSGAEAFALHDTYGFPIDLTLEMAAEAGLAVDETGFRALMLEQRQRAQADSREKKSGHADLSAFNELLAQGQTVFTGYSELDGESAIRGLLSGGQPIAKASQGQEIELVLAETPFYAEAGGQAADTGLISGDGFVIEVLDVQRPVKDLSVHKAIVREGEVAIGASVRAAVDRERRHAAEQAHTGTHIVHAALHQILGPEALQRGSFNKAGYLRFDFAWGEGLSTATRSEIEEVANIAIRNNYSVQTTEMPIDEAKALGAMALFGENYGSRVRVVEIDGAWSRELCGGTHVDTTSRIGSLTLLGEQSVGYGNRRVEAFVGMDAFRHLAAERALVSELTEIMKVPSTQLADRIGATLAKLRATEKELDRLRKAQLTAAAGELTTKAQQVGKTRLLTHDVGQIGGADELRSLALDLRERLGSEAAVVALTGESNDRPMVLVATNEAARAAGVKAGALVKLAAGVLGGGGGGKDDVAQGGGSNVGQIPAALAAINQAVAAL
ncbi:alanyl-tRNA synthetase [Renibacterium salmoninarum ATCC 33209]|uniref:Alanine--tRNA ligase n=1 Tax=Renibacterium salmoninarum (strain ATCC 33209 / DSM 20767 / JCM 11484 / NBRC 15589 / NCIMB 2235) TaxID=288705 RepID=SYA_RENSM|nr:alanine--tRNA ligase [Renibacterium salmoninarum]A9WSC4.1 RecName: Full=Alanine--tRNA ligase; AltName: Full=Alanyl-tRNA synthetase; Short=AlaRS [Renibacterium salmoninarum ATCC 33209]ABY23712.1 alanyl-tRNA synthetase [Renibacterium salmoninarum ATCC 33209]